MGIGSVRIGVILCGQGLAFEDLIPAAGFWAVEAVHCLLVEGLVDGLDSIRVIVCDFGIGQFLFQKIYTAIDYAKRIKMDLVRLPGVTNGLVGNPLILLLKEGAEGWSISTSVLCSCKSGVQSSGSRSQPLTDSVKMEILSLLGLYAGN